MTDGEGAGEYPARDAILQAARIATGQLGWTPETFWQATAAEFLVALEGKTGRLRAGANACPLGRRELLELMEKLDNG